MRTYTDPMPLTVVLTENALRERDVANILALHEQAAGTRYLLLVPADTDQNSLVEVINHLSLFEVRQAWEALTEQESPEQAQAAALESLHLSLERFAQAGTEASGAVVADDPLPALTAAVGEQYAGEIIVVTPPNAVEDTLHRDWASRAREDLAVPVLHFYSGTDFVGS